MIFKFHFLKRGFYSKKKEFAPKFFLFSIDFFLKGIDVQETKQKDTKVVSHVKNGRKSTQCIQSTYK